MRGCYAPINLKPAGGEGRAWGGDLTFFKNLPSNFLPTRLRVVSNFGDGDCGAGKIQSPRTFARVRVYFARPTITIAKIRDYSQSTAHGQTIPVKWTKISPPRAAHCPYTDRLHWPKNRLRFSLSPLKHANQQKHSKLIENMEIKQSNSLTFL